MNHPRSSCLAMSNHPTPHDDHQEAIPFTGHFDGQEQKPAFRAQATQKPKPPIPAPVRPSGVDDFGG
jgi:hypothetical protein